MVTVKKLSMAIVGAVISGLCLGVEAAHADDKPLVLPDGVFFSPSLLPTAVDDTVFITGKYTNGQYAVTDGFAPPREGPSPHRHFLDNEAFYIQEGKAAFHLGDQTFVGGPGDFVYIPQGKTHSWINLETTPDKFLVILDPAQLAGYLQELRQGQLRGGEQGYLEAIVKAAPDYATEVSDSLLFDDFEYKINEDGSSTAGVTVRRLGTSKEPASATIVLSDGTAKFGEDYSNTEIPVNFAPEEVTQVVDVPISLINDDLSEGNETIKLTLTNPSGDTIIAPLQNKAVLSIVDDNAPPGSDSTNTQLSAQELQELYGWPTLQRSDSQIQSFWLGGGTADVVATGKDTNDNYSLFDVLVPAETGLQPYINFGDNGFYILDGSVSFKLDDQTITLNPGNFLFLPKDTPYEFGNLATTSARLALISTPSASVPEPSSWLGMLGLGTYLGASLVLKRKHKKHKSANFSKQEKANNVERNTLGPSPVASVCEL
ncbi:cupin 2 domain-containing protein (plasmid) [Scytonema sp. HK-05]|uniref:cupin domain-containing protein n=1 Tax=Scytonema sp. HK-05 TaxID=1137095 RepID=UPI000937B277|nr:cupin domain-containing protein [Scytonema sp. HK-05]BAY50451.1 cupin 2 domain-containing protein [Scytonema sp. HK-05]